LKERLGGAGCEEKTSGGLLDLFLTSVFLNSRKGQEDEEGDHAEGEGEKEPHQRRAVLLSGKDDAENAGAEVAK
jgi:hypothetical protein